jgi:RNA polymerase sigma-70 factor (sigma-E family)
MEPTTERSAGGCKAWEGVQTLEEFVRTRAADLLRYGYVLTGSTHDGADLMQEALVRLGTGWSRVRQKGNPEGYVRTTMARLYVSWWRRRRREDLVGDPPERPADEHGGDSTASSDDSGLWQALLTLPPRRRAVLVLRYYEVYTDEEIAAILGISRATVRSHAMRGLDQLRTIWEPAAGGAAALLRERS